MSLAERINGDVAPAMKAKDTVRLEALCAAKTALMNKGIADGKPLAEGDAAKVIEMLIKLRKEAVELSRKGGRRRGRGLRRRDGRTDPSALAVSLPALNQLRVVTVQFCSSAGEARPTIASDRNA
jgi:hypothetical protein